MKFRHVFAVLGCVLVSPGSALAMDGNPYVRLTTKLLEGSDKCLEGNKFAPTSTLKGAAFMDSCQKVTGQMWAFVVRPDGYFSLQTKFQQPDNKCLEGNKVAESSTLGGAAFMDTCQNVTGQMWKIVPLKGTRTYFQLKTVFLEKENKCLDGNRYQQVSPLNGAAFMATCQEVPSQMWRMLPINKVPTN